MKKNTKKSEVRCPYCGAKAVLREGNYLFTHPTVRHMFVCNNYPECDSYVSAHEDTLLPMGMLADSKLRKKRRDTHLLFDQLWKKGVFSRRDAYKWLGDKFCLSGKDAHIGGFSEYMCDQLIGECQKALTRCGINKNSRPVAEKGRKIQ